MSIQIPSWSDAAATEEADFKTFTLSASSSGITVSRTFYLHNCNQNEFEAVTAPPGQSNPQTIYFVAEGQEPHQTPVQGAKVKQRDTEPESPDADTLYFIKEESLS